MSMINAETYAFEWTYKVLNTDRQEDANEP